jgi:hypothetical protein
VPSEVRFEDDGQVSSLLSEIVRPWHESLEDPEQCQNQTFRILIDGYAKTDYGKRFGAESISSLTEFQHSFPTTNYEALVPYFDEVRTGNYATIFPEPATQWVMTRGSTGKPKVIPVTESHLSQILSNGARAIINFALRRDLEVMKRNVLNLNFPSEVRTHSNEKGGVTKFGYSSGTYAKLYPSLDNAVLVPRQEEIDSIGGGIRKSDWNKRFELVYQRAKDSNVGSIMGVTPVLIEFATFLKRKHGILPKQLWKLNANFCTSVSKIQTKYAPIVKHFYGDAPIVEMYTATEGVFAQQLDDQPYVCPNYDTYVFEVKTRSETKMLYELQTGEWGRLIISSTLFPRYDIGDYIESVGKGYYRVFGRAKTSVALEHIAFNAMSFRFLRKNSRGNGPIPARSES